MEQERGKYLVFEGPGYSGKTKQSSLLAKRLESQGITVMTAEHPGTTSLGIENRRILLEERAKLSPERTLDLFSSTLDSISREYVAPNIEAGSWVVQTRHHQSMHVYQCKEMGADFQEFVRKRDVILNYISPDASILIDVPEHEVVRRMEQAHDRQRHSYNELDFQKIVQRRRYYLEVAQDTGMIVVDGIGSLTDVHHRVWDSAIASLGLETKIPQLV